MDSPAVILVGDPAPVIMLVECPFDEISLLLQFPFVPPGFLSIGLGRCDCRGASGPEKSQYLVALKSLVCERRAGLDTP